MKIDLFVKFGAFHSGIYRVPRDMPQAIADKAVAKGMGRFQAPPAPVRQAASPSRMFGRGTRKTPAPENKAKGPAPEDKAGNDDGAAGDQSALV